MYSYTSQNENSSYACYCEYDPPEWITTVKVKAARKQHKCSECGYKIAVREAYEYVCGKWDGYLSQFHTCVRCVELREWAIISVPCFCWAYGNLHDDVGDMVQETAPGIPGFFMEYGRRIVRIKRARNNS